MVIRIRKCEGLQDGLQTRATELGLQPRIGLALIRTGESLMLEHSQHKGHR